MATRVDIFLGILYIIWSWLKLYVYGGLSLLKQITETHKEPHNLQLYPGKVGIVTGGGSGIGFQISKGLVSRNVHVFIACSDEREGKLAIQEIREDYPNAKVDFLLLNLASLKSVKEFADNFLTRSLPLHLLINNAGIMFAPYQETEDDIELHFQVNYLGHRYLTELLLWKLQESGGDNSYARIINVSSIVHNTGVINIDSLGQRRTHWSEYSPHAAYADSKLAVVLSTYWLDNILRADKSKVSANVLHPGIVRTNLYRYVSPKIKWLLDIVARFTYKTPKQGADGILYLALSEEVEGETGNYYDNCHKISSKGSSYDKDLQKELWIKSGEILQQFKNRHCYNMQD